MSDPPPSRPDQPAPSPEPPVGRMALVTAVSLALAGTLFVWGLPLVGGSGARAGGGPGATQLHLTLGSRREVTAVFPGAATGGRLALSVDTTFVYPECTTQVVNGAPAYLSNCQDWHRAGYDVEIFHVTLTNRLTVPVAWQLSGFTLRSPARAPVQPLEPSEAGDVSLAAGGTIYALEIVSGYAIFDTGEGFVPSSLQYLDQEQLVVDLSGA